MTFTPEIYEQIRQGAQRSAAVIVPLVFRLAPDVRTVVDVGCGEGWFAREFAARGVEVFALDSEVETRDLHLGTGAGMIHFRKADLAAGDAWAGPEIEADLAVSLEVAEHLPVGAASAFVGTLCALAPIVLFSAAIPGQGGHGHLNEQWPRYWADLFAESGFTLCGALRGLIWNDDEIEPWYRQNLMLAVRFGTPSFATEPALLYGPERLGLDALPLVHPAIWEWRRQK